MGLSTGSLGVWQYMAALHLSSAVVSLICNDRFGLNWRKFSNLIDLKEFFFFALLENV